MEIGGCFVEEEDIEIMDLRGGEGILKVFGLGGERVLEDGGLERKEMVDEVDVRFGIILSYVGKLANLPI